MKNITSLLGSILLFAFLTSCATMHNTSQSSTEKIEVNDAFSKVYQAVQKAISKAGENTLRLESIDLAFATTTTTEVAGGIKLWVASGKYTHTSSKSKKATFTFGIPKASEKSFIENEKNKAFIDYVTSVIISANGVKSIDNFGLTDLEVEVEFTIKRAGELGVEIDLSPVTPSASINREKEIVHTITLKFKRK